MFMVAMHMLNLFFFFFFLFSRDLRATRCLIFESACEVGSATVSHCLARYQGFKLQFSKFQASRICIMAYASTSSPFTSVKGQNLFACSNSNIAPPPHHLCRLLQPPSQHPNIQPQARRIIHLLQRAHSHQTIRLSPPSPL